MRDYTCNNFLSSENHNTTHLKLFINGPFSAISLYQFIIGL